MKTVLGILIVAAAATTGDFIWYTYGVRHTMPAGLVHGALLLTTVGGVLGAANGRIARGLPIGTLSGIGGAAIYYLLIAVTNGRTYGPAIPAAWVGMWLILAALEGRWLRAPARRRWAEVAVRGVVAAVLGGVAFYLVLTTLWGRPPAAGRNYVLQFFAWAFAWTPGLCALTLRAPGSGLRATDTASASAQPENSITGRELLGRIDRGDAQRILDVRSEGEFATGHVPGAVNIPFNKLSSRLRDVPGTATDELVVYCGHGPRAYIAASTLRRGGWKRIVFLSGHWSAWRAAGLPVER